MEKLVSATLGGGCFWCLEAVYSRIDGVKAIAPGFAGGNNQDPTYEQVCSGETGHAEVIRISFDPNKISFEALLDWFWRCHDPTTLNRQGGDEGTQYRSVIFYENEIQKIEAYESKKLPVQRECLITLLLRKSANFQNFFLQKNIIMIITAKT